MGHTTAVREEVAGFTPGPWFVRRATHGGSWYVEGAHRRGGDLWLVAEVCGQDAEPDLANARLIAAAPDLLAACEAMDEWDRAEKGAPPYDSDGGAHFRQRIALCDRAFELARAAIAKARALPTNSGGAT